MISPFSAATVLGRRMLWAGNRAAARFSLRAAPVAELGQQINTLCLNIKDVKAIDEGPDRLRASWLGNFHRSLPNYVTNTSSWQK
jgi:hypothetical protein